MRRSCFAILLLAWSFAGESAPAQSRYEMTTGLERDISRYRWTGGLDIRDRFGDWTVTASNRFVSDAFILFDDNLSFQDENRLVWVTQGDVHRRWSVTAAGTLGWFSLSRVLRSSAYAGFRYRPQPHLWIEPRLGAALDRRPGAQLEAGIADSRSDAGPAYGVGFEARSLSGSPWLLRVSGLGHWQIINPRRGRDVRLDATADRQSGALAFSSRLYVSSARRDSYQAVSFLNRNEPALRSESIEATRTDTLQLVSRLTAPIADRLLGSVSVTLGANRRTVRTLRAPEGSLFFDTNFDRRLLDVAMDLEYRRRVFDGSVGLRAGAQNEERSLSNRDELSAAQAAQKTDLLRQADFDRGFFELRGRSSVRPLRFLSLHFDGSASILRHDTPAVNPDDRDERLLTGRAGVRVRFSEYLATEMSLFASRYETVYLKAVRSAENNVQRALRFRPSIIWTPSAVTSIRFTPEVRATYTVDDFVLAGRQARDQSARELRYEVDAEHRFPGNFRLALQTSYSDLRLGRFLDDAFAEIPFDTLQTISGWVRLYSDGYVKASAGLRLFIRSDYNRSTAVRYTRVNADGSTQLDSDGLPIESVISRPGRETIAQIGPTASISWPIRRNTSLVFDGWLVLQRITQKLYGSLPAGQEAAIERAASRGRRTLIPNMSMTAIWRF